MSGFRESLQGCCRGCCRGWSGLRRSAPLAALACLAVLIAAVLVPVEGRAASNPWQAVDSLVGDRDAVAVAAPDGRVLYARNSEAVLPPASVLKIVTALMARHWLGPDFRFTTQFHLTKTGDLVIKGLGDPLLTSEVVKDMTALVAAKVPRIRDIVVDDSWFGDVTIPGVTSTLNPYDAPNGALCVNFNTVTFRSGPAGFESAEPQTPLLPLVLDRVRASRVKEGRVMLPAADNLPARYAGHLFRHFLIQAGAVVDGEVRTGLLSPEDRLVLRFPSPFSLDEVIAKMLEFSNNFTANQLFLACGVTAREPPATLDKSRAAARAFLESVLGTSSLVMDEGSGISRENGVTAASLLKALDAFAPLYRLMRSESGEYYKTGHLKGVRTRAGYLERNGAMYRFVVLLNTPSTATDARMAAILDAARMALP